TRSWYPYHTDQLVCSQGPFCIFPAWRLGSVGVLPGQTGTPTTPRRDFGHWHTRRHRGRGTGSPNAASDPGPQPHGGFLGIGAWPGPGPTSSPAPAARPHATMIRSKTGSSGPSSAVGSVCSPSHAKPSPPPCRHPFREQAITDAHLERYAYHE